MRYNEHVGKIAGRLPMTYNLGNDLITVTPLGEIVKRDLSFVALLLDVIQNSRELVRRHESGEHCYWLAF
jgi:hypothetical protein